MWPFSFDNICSSESRLRISWCKHNTQGAGLDRLRHLPCTGATPWHAFSLERRDLHVTAMILHSALYFFKLREEESRWNGSLIRRTKAIVMVLQNIKFYPGTIQLISGTLRGAHISQLAKVKSWVFTGRYRDTISRHATGEGGNPNLLRQLSFEMHTNQSAHVFLNSNPLSPH